MVRRIICALTLAFAMAGIATVSAEALSCSDHRASCKASCAARNPHSATCIGPHSGCNARFKECMRTGAWTSLVDRPGTRPAERR